MPPKKKTQPSQAERDAFVLALRNTFRQADAHRPRDPGPYVVRRLNRAEYDNTIRDLFMIEYQPSVAFPPDNRHHGFENIATSLSLSPVLMERYLNAAEAVVTRGLRLGEDNKPKTRVGLAQYMNRGTNLPHRLGIYTSEPVHFDFVLAAGGEYELHIAGRPLMKDGPAAQVSLRLDGREIGKISFPFQDGRPPSGDFKLKLKRGRQRITLVYLNPPPEQEAKKASFPLRVDFSNKEKLSGLQIFKLNLTGPMETQPEGCRRIMACDPEAEPQAKAQQILSRFASRAFRRPVTPVETSVYLQVFDAALKRGKSFDASIGTALQAILVSPHFLFRVERDPKPDADDAHPVSDYQLATRLSYFLWSSMPDDELFDLASRHELAVNLESQVRRMLKDWKSAGFIENFAPQWLMIQDLDRVNRNQRHFDPRMRTDMSRETLRFFESVLRENRPITAFIDGRFTFLNQRLGRFYGLEKHFAEKGIALPDQPLVRVSLPADGARAGILTHGSVLTATSAPTRTSPVKRGIWILENILGSPPPPPPPDAPPLDESGKGDSEGKSLREQLEAHRDHAQCAACHNRIDPLGFALEKFDNIGRARLKYDRNQVGDHRGPKVDDRVELSSGRQFEGVGGLREVLLERREQFTRCLVEKVLTYALGRGVGEYDLATIDDITDAVVNDEFRFQRLIMEVIQSAPFRLRRGKNQQGN